MPDQDVLPVLDQSLVEQRASTLYNNRAKGGPNSSWVASYSLRSQIVAPEPGPAQLFPPILSYDATVLADAPVGFWPLNDGSGVTAVDAASSHYDGSYVNGPTLGVTGIGDNETAATFTAAATQCVAPSASLIFNQANATIEAWVYIGSAPAANEVIAGCVNGLGSSTSDKVLYIATDGKPYFYVFAGTGITTPAPLAALPTNQWVHIVATADSSNLFVYVNGAQVSTVAAGATYVSYSAPNFWIAATTPVATYFNGSIAKVALYDHALTSTQIAAHHAAQNSVAPGVKVVTAATAVVSTPTLLNIGGGFSQYDKVVLTDSPSGYWPLNDTGGTSAVDASGNGLTGSYVGGCTPGQPGIGDGETATALNGTSGYVTTPPASSLYTATVYSAEVWVNPTSTVISGDVGVISLFGSAGWVIQQRSSGNWSWYINGTRADATVAAGWTHLVGTLDGTTMRLYVNGAPAASTAASTTAQSSVALLIGALTTTSQFFAGTIAKAAGYNYALTAAQISAHYAAQTAASSSAGPIAATTATASITIPAPVVLLTPAAIAVGVATATVIPAASLTAQATAIGQAAAQAQANARLAATAQSITAATLAVSAPGALTATAQALTLASASTTARAATTPAATAVTQTQATLAAPARLTPTAQAVAQAQSTAQTTAPLTVASQAIAQATGVVTAIGAQNLTVAAQAVAQATTALTAPAQLAGQASAISSSTATATANAQLVATSTAITQTTVAATANAQLAPTATAISLATLAVTIPTAAPALTPIAQATTASTLTATARTQLVANATATGQTALTLTVPGVALLTPTATATSQALALLSTRALLTANATSASSATLTLTVPSVVPLTATATTTTQAQSRVTAAYVTTKPWLTVAADELLNASSAASMQVTATTTATWAWASATGDEADDTTSSSDTVKTLVYAGEE